MFNLCITPKAESDLIQIWVYTREEWGVDQADNYLDQLEAGMQQLINYPSLGVSYDDVFPGYRRLQVQHHAVFYQVPKSKIVIVRVLHESMDAPKTFLD